MSAPRSQCRFFNQRDDYGLKNLKTKLGYLVLIGIIGIGLVCLMMIAIGLLAALVFVPLLEFVLRLFTNVGR
jgi:hypothetical protein